MGKRVLLLVVLAWVVSFLPVAVLAQESEDSQRIREEIRKHKEAITQLREKLHEIETPPMAQVQSGSTDYQQETSGGESYGNEGDRMPPLPPRKNPIGTGEPLMGKEQMRPGEGVEGQHPGMRRQGVPPDAKKAIKDYQVDLILLDDGFQLVDAA